MKRELILLSCFFCVVNSLSYSAQIYQDMYDANVISEAGPVKFNTDLHFLVGEKDLKKVSDLSLQEEVKQTLVIDERVRKVLEEKERQILALGKKEAKTEVKTEIKKEEIQPKIMEVHFNFDSYKLVESEKEKLIKEIEGLKKEGFFKVKITGYADITGRTRHNLWLSRKRAEVVADFFKKNGFEIIEVKGLGELDKDDVFCLNRKVVLVFERKIKDILPQVKNKKEEETCCSLHQE